MRDNTKARMRIGQRYGNLVIVGVERTKGNSSKIYRCKCDCGKVLKRLKMLAELKNNKIVACPDCVKKIKAALKSTTKRPMAKKHVDGVDWVTSLRVAIYEIALEDLREAIKSEIKPRIWREAAYFYGDDFRFLFPEVNLESLESHIKQVYGIDIRFIYEHREKFLAKLE